MPEGSCAVVSCFAVPTPPASYGGAELVAYLSAKYLSRYYDVTLIAAKGSEAPKGCDLVETVEPTFTAQAELAAWHQYKDMLNDFDILIDHTHQFYAYRAKLENPQLKVLKIVHDYLPWSAAPPRKSYDIIAGVSKFHAGVFREQWGVDAIHLYNGIEIERYKFRKDKEDFILFLNRLHPGKGAHIFVGLCEKLGVRGLLVGDDDVMHGIDPDYRDYVMLRCQKVGVEYLGRVDEDTKLELLSRAKAVVAPLCEPYKEVFGLYIIESLSSGTPVFVTDQGSPAELLGGLGLTSCGYVAKNVKELENTLKQFLDGKMEFDPKNCRKRAEYFGINRYEDYLHLKL
ncbi:MAG: glycosyltransferase [Methermicoccaceae archaeon]